MRLVVGIPTRNEAPNIPLVTAVVDVGLFEHFPNDDTYIVNADNASADGTQDAFLATPTRATKTAINTGAIGTGKGTNMFATLEFARSVDADAVCFIDGDVRSVRPDWVSLLLRRSLSANSSKPTFVTPQYARSRYEANTTNQLVRPYLHAAFGLDIAQPIGGEFAMNQAFVTQALTWARVESTELYGIDVWLTVNAALHGFDLEHVFMGRKMHNPTFPKIFRLGQQVLDALFRLMMEQRPVRPCLSLASDSTVIVDEQAIPLSQELIAPVVTKAAAYIIANWDDLVFTFPALLSGSRPKPGVLPMIETGLWCEILADAYIQLDENNFRRVRDHLVALFPARVTTFWREISGMRSEQTEDLLAQQNQGLADIFSTRILPSMPVSLHADPALQAGAWDEVLQLS